MLKTFQWLPVTTRIMRNPINCLQGSRRYDTYQDSTSSCHTFVIYTPTTHDFVVPCSSRYALATTGPLHVPFFTQKILSSPFCVLIPSLHFRTAPFPQISLVGPSRLGEIPALSSSAPTFPTLPRNHRHLIGGSSYNGSLTFVFVPTSLYISESRLLVVFSSCVLSPPYSA